MTQTEYNIIELLSVHAVHIQKKLGEQPGAYLYILNELGVGYRMNEENEV